MAHNIKPNKEYKIISIDIAVPADADEGYVSDEISTMLTNCAGEEGSSIADWIYTKSFEEAPVVKSGDDPGETDIFYS